MIGPRVDAMPGEARLMAARGHRDPRDSELDEFADALSDVVSTAAIGEESGQEVQATDAPFSTVPAPGPALQALVAQLLEPRAQSGGDRGAGADVQDAVSPESADGGLDVITAKLGAAAPPVQQPAHIRRLDLREDGHDGLTPRVSAAPQSADKPQASAWRHATADHSETVRFVDVKHVSSTVHYPVVSDPVKQIAVQVADALGEVAPASAPGQAMQQASQPTKVLEVHLEPDSLGSVTVRMKLSAGNLSIRLEVAEPATLDMIRQEQDRLQKALASDMCQIDRLEIRGVDLPAAVTQSESSARLQQDNSRMGEQPRGQGDGANGHNRGREEPGGSDRNRKHSNDNSDSSRERRDSLRGLYL